MKVDRGHVVQRLVRSPEVVLYQPLGQMGIEPLAVQGQIAQLDELFPEGAVKSLIHRIVSRGPRSGEVMREMEQICRIPKVLGKLGSIVSLNVFDLSGKKVVHTLEKISRMTGMLALIHPGKGNLGVNVDAGQDVAPSAVPIDRDPVECYEKPASGLFLEIGDALLGLTQSPASPEPCRILGMIVQPMFLDHPLDLPGRDGSAVGFFIQTPELLLAIADAGFAECDDTQLLLSRYGPLAHPVRPA